MPRLIEQRVCPHCGEELPDPKPRSCPSCAGSLQQRHLRAGCLQTGAVLLAGWTLWSWLAA